MPCAGRSLQKKPATMGGFTAIELLVAVLVLGILATLAAPDMTNFILSTRIKSVANDMYSTLIFARSEAIKRNASVSIVPIAAWQGGWQVTVGATVLRQQDAYPSNIGIAGPAGTITYQRDGRLTGNAIAAFTINAPGKPAVPTKTVSIDLGGRALVK